MIKVESIFDIFFVEWLSVKLIVYSRVKWQSGFFICQEMWQLKWYLKYLEWRYDVV